MASRGAKLSDDVRTELAALGRAASGPSGTVEIALNGPFPVGSGEVLVVVLSRDAALVSRRSVRGRAVDLKELRRQLAGAELALEALPGDAERGGLPELAQGEAAMLDAAGLTEDAPDAVGALERSRIALDMLLRESLTLEEAARALRVSTGRLRQRLGPGERTLYGIKEGRVWRIPRFQFASKGKLVRGIEHVLPHLRPDAHPLAVKTWFSSPHQDLVVGPDDEPVTPRAWLLAGRSPAAVAELAGEV